MMPAAVLLAAYMLDLLIGDPSFIPHPVVWMGKAIAWMDRLLRPRLRARLALRLAGMALPVALVGGSCGLTWLLLDLLRHVHPLLAALASVWMISTTVATKGLADAAMRVYKPLARGETGQARQALSMIVGRDTAGLGVGEISRGAVETVAENIVDAVVAPLFYAALGGAPLAMAYRAVNTLDSMVGYKNETYRHFGWASARLDDLANFIPARIAAILLVLVSFPLKLDGRRAWRAIARDASKHPSPNSGLTEAGTAGALGIRLGGWNTYRGVPSFRAYLGDELRTIEAAHIPAAVRIMRAVCACAAIVCAAVACCLALIL